MRAIKNFILITTLLGLCGGAIAQGNPAHRIRLDIQSQPLPAALQDFAAQAGLQIMYRVDDVAKNGITSPRIAEDLTVDEALKKLLANSGLKYEFVNDRMVRITPSALDSSAMERVVPRVDEKPIRLSDGNARRAEDGKVSAESTDNQNGSDNELLVKSRRPFTDGNMDIVRTEDDAQPYQIISREDIEKSGASDIESLLKKHLPMNTVASTHDQQSINAGGDVSQVNLRGIGTNQTLILINGRRTANIVSFGETLQPDIKAIPIGAVERIEVLPVSSSAIYGGSAIGGVVNVVLKRDYEGGQFGVSYRSPFDVNAPVRTVNASYGASLEGGKTHILVGARYSDSDAPLSRDRPDFLNRGRETILRNNPGLLLLPTAPYIGGTTGNIGSVNGANLVLKPAYGGMSLGSNITYVPIGASGATAPLDLGAGFLTNAGAYNFSQPNSAGQDAGYGLNSRIHGAPQINSVIASARRQATDKVGLFFEFYHSNYQASARRVPYAASRVRVSRSSPVNPFDQDVRVTLPAAASGEEEFFVRNKTTRFTGGVLVDLTNDWQLESDYTWTHNEGGFRSKLYSSPLTIAPAVNAGTLNPFVDLLANPVNLEPYKGSYGGDFPSRLGNVAIRVAGPVGRLPAGSPTLAVGLEHRKEQMERGGYFWDYAEYPANNLNWNYLPKSQRVLSAYAELKVPLVSKGNNVPLVRELDLQLAGRTEHFNVATGTAFIASPTEPVSADKVTYSSTNPTIGLRYKPVEQLMLRASYATGFLPPDYSQFLEPQLGGGCTAGAACTVNVIDPLRGNEVIGVSFLAGGNPNIKPQNSTSWGVGLVWTPEFIKGLRANLEWYRLELKDVAVTPTPQQIVNLEGEFPGRVQRGAAAPGDPYALGPITLVDYSLINANQVRTEGIDLSLDYRFSVDRVGTFQLSAMATAVRYFERQAATIDSPLENIINQVANGGPLKHKGNLGLSWMRGSWKVDWLMTYFGSYDQFDNGGVTAYVLAQGSNKIPSQSYHDVVFEYNWADFSGSFGSLLSGVTLQLGVNNVFDKAPPLDIYFNQTGYYSPFGDSRLREYWLSLNKRF